MLRNEASFQEKAPKKHLSKKDTPLKLLMKKDPSFLRMTKINYT
jgi:hypothetical protein